MRKRSKCEHPELVSALTLTEVGGENSGGRNDNAPIQREQRRSDEHAAGNEMNDIVDEDEDDDEEEARAIRMSMLGVPETEAKTDPEDNHVVEAALSASIDNRTVKGIINMREVGGEQQ